MIIFFRIERARVVRKLYKKFQQIYASDAPVEQYNFFSLLAVARKKAVLNSV